MATDGQKVVVGPTATTTPAPLGLGLRLRPPALARADRRADGLAAPRGDGQDAGERRRRERLVRRLRAAAGDLVALGAPRHKTDAGAVYVFRTSDGGVTYGQVAKVAHPAIADGTCAATCSGYSCDTWFNAGYACSTLEGTFGCDCSGCSCGAGYLFGWSVALAGDRLVVGAGCPAWWIMGLCDYANAAIVFRTADNGASWTHLATLTAADAGPDTRFGSAVAAAGTVVAVGAPHDDGGGGLLSGAVYLFATSDNGATWAQQTAKLKAADAAAYDTFGISVATDGATVLAGAYGDGNAGSDGQNNPVGAVGAVYVYRASDGAQLAKLTASDAATGDMFGFSVAIEGSTVAIGARGDGSNAGAVYLYDTATWAETAKLAAADAAAGDLFGYSLSLSGDGLAVGAMGDDGAAGSVYLFRTDGTTWAQYDEVTSGDAAAGNVLGYSVALSGDRVVSGAPNEDELADNACAAYAFVPAPTPQPSPAPPPPPTPRPSACRAAADARRRPADAGAQRAPVVAADAGAQRAADPETDADPDAPAVAGTHAEAIIPADAQADALALAAPDPETDAGPDARARRSDGRAGLRTDASPDAQPDAEADASARSSPRRRRPRRLPRPARPRRDPPWRRRPRPRRGRRRARRRRPYAGPHDAPAVAAADARAVAAADAAADARAVVGPDARADAGVRPLLPRRHVRRGRRRALHALRRGLLPARPPAGELPAVRARHLQHGARLGQLPPLRGGQVRGDGLAELLALRPGPAREPAARRDRRLRRLRARQLLAAGPLLRDVPRGLILARPRDVPAVRAGHVQRRRRRDGVRQVPERPLPVRARAARGGPARRVAPPS